MSLRIKFFRVMVPLLFVGGGLAGLFLLTGSKKPVAPPILFTVQPRVYQHRLFLAGEVESAVNVDIKSEVAAVENWLPKIKEVVPDGQFVREGEVILRIDTSVIEEMLELQQIHHREHVSEEREFEMMLHSYETERLAYIGGDLEIARLNHSSKIFIAKEKEKEQRRILDDSLDLFNKGYVSESQLSMDWVALQKANNQLELEILKSDVLERFTSQLAMLTLDMKIYATKVRLSTNQRILVSLGERVDKLQKRLDKSVITAPQDGMAVHVPLRRREGNQTLTVGEELFEGRVVMKLPNPAKMQVAVKIEEKDLPNAKVGTSARITFEAIDGGGATGRLESVRPFADNEEWMSRAGKRYSAVVSLDPESVHPFAREIRCGLSAAVELQIDRREEVLMVPNHAVFDENGSSHCLVWQRGRSESRPIEILTENGSFSVVGAGLARGERVVCGVRSHREPRP